MTKVKVDELVIDGVTYVPKDSRQRAENLDGMPYVIVRTYSAGVFAGYLEKREGKEAVIRKSRRLWYWSGASSLSQLAEEGVKNPNDCKFPCEVDRTEVTEAIEVLFCSEEARICIQGVKIWQQ